jgi:hypothetical protein
MSQESETARVTVTVHPPEHGRRANVPAQAGGCCCSCCCCCLHTIGGIVGAVIGPKLGERPKDWSHLALMDDWDEDEYRPGASADAALDPEAITENAPPPAKESADSRFDVGDSPIALSAARRSAASLFWWTLLVMSIGWMVWHSLADPNRMGEPGSRIVAAAFFLVLLYPLVQLAAALVTAFILAVSSRLDKRYQFGQLGKLTLGTVAGTVAGILPMACLLLALGGGAGIAVWLVLILIIGALAVGGLIALARR